MLPRVVLHNTVSLDGRIDWFAADIGLYYELASRWQVDAHLAGSDTMLAMEGELADDGEAPTPEVNPDDPRPLLVVPDSRGRLRKLHLLPKLPYWRGVLALCSETTPRTHLSYLQEKRIEYLVAGQDHVDLRAALEALNARYGVRTVHVDSGGTLNGVLLRAGLVDEISVLIHPSLVGGITGRSIFRAPDLTSPEGVTPLRLTHVERLHGDIVWLRYEVVR